MKLTRNIFLAVAIIGILYFFTATDSFKQKSLPKSSSPGISEIASKPLYDPSDVSSLTWSFKDKSMEFKKNKNQWTDRGLRPLEENAGWQVVRRVAVLAKSDLVSGISIAVPLGHFSEQIKGTTWDGIYDGQKYLWNSGPQSGKGIDFSSDTNLKDLFNEGLFAFQSHKIKWCQSNNLQEVDFKNEWTLKKQNKKWTVQKNHEASPARMAAVEPFLKRACELTADVFIADPGDGPKDSPAVLKLMESKNKTSVQVVNKIYFTNKVPAFRSQDLDDLLATNLDEIKDSSLEEGRIALDPAKSTPERVAAIRKIKDLRSTEGLPALKALIFEKTDLDVYRYEAVDALAAIGTKEAYKIIGDRLAQVGRSGFELRLARALSAAMGRVFRSDEKTSEDIRRPEVNELLQAFKKNPPGK